MSGDPYDFDAPKFADLAAEVPNAMSPGVTAWFGELH